MAIKNTQNDNESLNDVAVGAAIIDIIISVDVCQLWSFSLYGTCPILFSFADIFMISLPKSIFWHVLSHNTAINNLRTHLLRQFLFFNFPFKSLKILNMPFSIWKINSINPFIRSIKKKFFDSLTVKFHGRIEPSIEPIIPTKYCT